MSDYVIYMGLKQRLSYDFVIEKMFTKCTIKWFDTTTKRAINYIENTPYNKGCLIKLRKYFKHYEVWYATKKICYCSTLNSALKEIAILNNH